MKRNQTILVHLNHQPMKTLLTLAVILVLSLMAFAQKKPSLDTRLAGIDAKLEALLAEWKVAGFAVAVVEKNKVVYAKGFGYRDLENKKPATANTLFAIGSCSKAFTSALLGQLRQDKKLAFSDKPGQYIPGLKFFSDDLDEDLTISDLMCHRTGLPRHDFAWYFFNTNSRDTLIQKLQYQEPSAGVRQRYQYNNFMFMLQGVITEKITGKSWEDNIREKFFNPLSMTTSNLSMLEMEKSAEPSLGYEVKNNKEIKKLDYFHIRGMAPAGSINSSVNEMANWMKLWIYGGKYNGKELLPAAYVTEAMSAQMVASAGLPTQEHPDVQFNSYGYGWGLNSYKGHYRVSHGGNIDGFSASTTIFPSDSIGIVVLVNQNRSTLPAIVRNIMADRMLKLSQTDWSKELKTELDKNLKLQTDANAKASANEKKGTKPSRLLEQFEGQYSHPGYGTFRMFVKRDSLFGTSGLQTFWMRHVHYDVFQPFMLDRLNKIDTAEKNEMRFNFRTGLDGELEAVSISGMEPNVKPLEFVAKPSVKAIKPEDLKKYVGDYELAGAITKVFIKGESSLILFVPGQPEYDLQYLGGHKFGIKVHSGYKIEFEETEGTITGVAFIQPNGTFKAKKK
jgi:CubicO group peptidase (beta-lactamase class C family)